MRHEQNTTHINLESEVLLGRAQVDDTTSSTIEPVSIDANMTMPSVQPVLTSVPGNVSYSEMFKQALFEVASDPKGGPLAIVLRSHSESTERALQKLGKLAQKFDNDLKVEGKATVTERANIIYEDLVNREYLYSRNSVTGFMFQLQAYCLAASAMGLISVGYSLSRHTYDGVLSSVYILAGGIIAFFAVRSISPYIKPLQDKLKAESGQFQVQRALSTIEEAAQQVSKDDNNNFTIRFAYAASIDQFGKPQ